MLSTLSFLIYEIESVMDRLIYKHLARVNYIELYITLKH
jgi:hypothetical protein